MKFKNTQSFTDKIKNYSEKTGVDVMVLQRLYMMECFLERLSKSKYKEKFVLKGGTLVGALVGSSLRSTMDIDQTVVGINLSKETAINVILEIISTPVNDGILFSLDECTPIMENCEYPGLRIHLSAKLNQTKIPVLLDLSTGDAITPKEIEFSYPRLFGGTIPLFVYPVETLIAEKLETILSRGTANTRMKDYYDIFLLAQSTFLLCPKTLKKAFHATLKQRKTSQILDEVSQTISSIETSKTLQKRWSSFQKSYPYVTNVSWLMILTNLKKTLTIVLE